MTIALITNTEKHRHALLLPGYIHVRKIAIKVQAMLDSGADAVIISKRLVERYNLLTVKLPKPLTIRNADKSVNKQGLITHRVKGHFIVNRKKLPTYWYVADIGKDDALIGMPWMRQYNPEIDWETGHITIKDAKIKWEQKVDTYRHSHEPPPRTI